MEKRARRSGAGVSSAKKKNVVARGVSARADRGARGGRGPGRGRGRGRGRGGSSARVMFAWNDDEDEREDASGDEDEAVEEEMEEMTESDYERQDAEIDGVVDVAELETFAGTMVVDADDVALQRETLAAAVETGEQQKKNKTKKKQKNKTRVSVVVAESDVLEVVQLEGDAGVTESGEIVQITLKEKKTKKKKKKNAQDAAEDEKAKYEAVEVQEVPELVEVPVKKEKKKKEKKEKLAIDAGVTDNKLVAIKSKKATPKVAAEPEAETKVDASGKSNKKKKKKAEHALEDAKLAVGHAAAAKKTDGAAKKVNKDAKIKSAPIGDEATNDRPKRDNFYEDYGDRKSVMEAIERGELFQGKLRINPQYRMRAFLAVEGIAVDVLIDGVKDRNRAMDGDLVAIKLHDEDKWKPLQPSNKDEADKETKKPVVEKNGAVPAAFEIASRKDALHALWRPTLETSRCFLPSDKIEPASATGTALPLSGARKVFERSQELKCRPTARVVFIVAPGNAQGFVGSLEPKSKLADISKPLPPHDDYAYFNAQDPRIPRRIRIPRLQLPDEFVSHPLKYSQEMMCFCRITKWSVSHESPMGEFVKTLGEYSGIESGISAILMKHGLLQHTLDFRHEIIAELDEKYGTGGEKWAIPNDELAKRRDFRTHQIFSIDPYNARDLDDALHITALDKEETLFEVGVHIADVTHFIEKGCLLDVEAQQRATSVYLANRVLPMLPRILCERLCSLQPQVDRLAFSVVWQMNSDGSLVDGCVPWFGKSIIRSCCKLDYGTAQRMLDDVVTKDKLDEWEIDRRPAEGDNAAITPASVITAVKHLWKVAKNRRTTRFDTGAVTLQDIKLTFSLDARGNPVSYGTYQLKDSNRLVEEYMLLANYLVAQRLLQAHGPLAFIRRHPEPNETALETTLSILSENTIDIDGSSPKKLSDSLETVRAARGNYVYGVVQNMITKPMKPAEYLVAGNAGHDSAWRHYALNIPYYTHFTSPIRRYADVAVHRLLQESVVDAENVAARVDSGGDELSQLMTEYSSVAQNCNEKKMTSKNAEKDCDQVFLCAYVKHHGTVDVTGVVVSTGQRSFTVYISELGLEQRIEVRELGSVRWSWQEATTTLSLMFNSLKSRRARNRNKKAGAGTDNQEEEEKQAEAGSNHGATAAAASPEVATTPVAAPAVPEVKVDLKFLTKLRMLMTTTDKMPLALKFEVVGHFAA